MHNALKQIFLLFLIVFMSACGSDELNKIEEIIDSDPESALATLEDLKPEYYEMSDKDKALFGVLYFQALNKKGLDLSPVEMINFSIDYYSKKDNKYYLAYSCLYKARFLRNNQQLSEAVELLFDALELGKICMDENLLGRIYLDIGFIALKQGEYKKSEKYYNYSTESFRKINNNESLVKSLLGVGVANNRLKDYSKALDYYKEAVSICTDSLDKGNALFQIGNNYYYTMEYDSALHYISRSLDHPFIGNGKAVRYLTLGQIYFDLKIYDKASLYAFLALSFPNDFYVQRESYVVLANIASQKNNKVELAIYLEKYQACVDSIIKLESQPKITTIEEVHYANQRVRQVHKNRYVFAFAAVFLVIIVGIVFYIVYRQQSKQKLQDDENYKEKLDNKQRVLKHEVILNKIKELKGDSDNKPMNQEDREQLYKIIYEQVLNYSDEKAFLKKMNSIFNGLPDKLSEYPSITYKDILWCCLHLLEVSNYDMSIIFECKVDTIYTMKQRVAKKLKLANGSELEVFLKEIST